MRHLMILLVGVCLLLTSVPATAGQAEEELSIMRIRTCQINTSVKGSAEGRAWAKEITEYLNGKFPDLKVRVYMRVFGPLYSVNWVTSYKDLAAYEISNKRVAGDTGYQERLTKAVGLFSDCEDRLFGAIP